MTLREQHLKEDIRRLIEDLATSYKSSRHKTRKTQERNSLTRITYCTKEHQTNLVYTAAALDL
jgi:uncharacterized protein (DUF2461 family)